MTKEDYTTLKQAIDLKELGFIFGLHGKYSKGKLTLVTSEPPSLALAAKWLREKHHLAVIVKLNGVRTMWFSEIWEMIPNGKVYDNPGVLYDSYEDALSAGIDNAIEILKEKIDNEPPVQCKEGTDLTWQDIRRIVKIADAELGRHTQDELAEMGEEKYYETILNKYNQPR